MNISFFDLKKHCSSSGYVVCPVCGSDLKLFLGGSIGHGRVFECRNFSCPVIEIRVHGYKNERDKRVEVKIDHILAVSWRVSHP